MHQPKKVTLRSWMFISLIVAIISCVCVCITLYTVHIYLLIIYTSIVLGKNKE